MLKVNSRFVFNIVFIWVLILISCEIVKVEVFSIAKFKKSKIEVPAFLQEAPYFY